MRRRYQAGETKAILKSGIGYLIFKLISQCAITDEELARTSVYAIAIDSWSGKENWAERAEQSGEWTPICHAEP